MGADRVGEGNYIGRVPTGIAEAIHRGAMRIFWGTGASKNQQGTKESQYTFDQATGPKLDELALGLKITPTELFAYLKEVSILDTSSQNTTEEIHLAAKECVALGIKELYLISSPTHITRCLQEDRGDMPKVPFHKSVRGIFPILRNEKLAFSLNSALAALIGEYKKKLDDADALA